MKFCPYCGASLVGGAVSFCAECGEKLTSMAKQPRPTRDYSPRQYVPTGKKAPSSAARPHVEKPKSAGNPASRSREFGKFPFESKTSAKKKHPSDYPPKPDLRDEGYDGYYDDVIPIDDGHERDRTDPELVKRVILISAGAFAIVLFSAVLMYVL